MDSVTYRWFREGDEPALLELLQAAFGRWPGVDVPCEPIEHLRWKLAVPNGATACCVAVRGGEIIAAQICAFQHFLLHGREVTALRGWDTATHPHYQRLGLMQKLRSFRIAEVHGRCDFEIGTWTNHPAMAALHEHDGRLDLGGGSEVLIAPVTARAALSALKVRLRVPGKLVRSSAAFARWAGARRAAARVDHAFVIRDIARFDDRANEFGAQASKQFSLILERTSEYLNWRYCDQRGGSFAVKIAEEEGQILGYAVLRINGGRAHLADILVLPGREDVVRALANAIIHEARNRGLDRLEFLAPKTHPFRRALADSGFVGRRARKVPPSYLPLRMSSEELSSLSSPGFVFHWVIGDSDII
jgi:GNAT superfamily N-acetyltransferase